MLYDMRRRIVGKIHLLARFRSLSARTACRNERVYLTDLVCRHRHSGLVPYLKLYLKQ